MEKKIEEEEEALGSTRGTVTSFGYKSTNPIRLIRQLAIDAKAARHSGTGSGSSRSTALAQQAQLEGCQPSSPRRRLN